MRTGFPRNFICGESEGEMMLQIRGAMILVHERSPYSDREPQERWINSTNIAYIHGCSWAAFVRFVGGEDMTLVDTQEDVLGALERIQQ